MKRIFALFLFLCMMVTLLPKGGVTPVAAQEATPTMPADENPCNGLDVVFLVAQSGAMKVNDPYYQRRTAIYTALDVIGDNALYFCPGFQHRLAVVGFGDRPFVNMKDHEDYVSPTILKADIKDTASWIEQKYNLRGAIPLHDSMFDRFENYEAALIRASEILAAWREQPLLDPAGGRARKQAVIIISDAMMCSYEDECRFPVVIEKLRPIVSEQGKYLPYYGADNPGSVSISLIAFNNLDSGGTNFPEVPEIKDFWAVTTRSHGGNFVVLQQGIGADKKRFANADLTTQTVDVLNQLLGSNLQKYKCEPIWIEPYRNTVSILHILRKGANAGVEIGDVEVIINIEDAKGNITRISNGQPRGGFVYIQEGPNERYYFNKPTPGKVTIEVNGADACNDIDLQFGESGATMLVNSPKPEVRLQEVDKEPFYDRENAIRLALQFQEPDANGNMLPLVEIPNYPLTGKVTITSQNPDIEPVVYRYDFVRTDDEKAIYESVLPGTITPAYLLARYPGWYLWELEVSTPDPRTIGQPGAVSLTIFKDEGLFEVVPLEREFDLKIIEPRIDKPLSMLEGQPFTLNVEVQLLIDGKDMPSNLNIMIDDEKAPLQAVLTRPDGKRGEPVLLQHLGRNRFGGQIPSGGSNPNIFDEGKYTIEVSLTDDYRSSIFHPVWDENPTAQIAFIAAKQFTWAIRSPLPTPENYPLYPSFALFPKVQPVLLEVLLRDARGEEVLNGQSVVVPGMALFTGTLEGPGITTPIQLEFTLDEETGSFVAAWPEKANREGTYTLKVSPSPEAAQAQWLFKDTTTGTPVEFIRKNALVNQPWALPALVALVIALILLGILLYNVITRPRGVLRLVNYDTQSVLYEIYLGRALKGWAHTYKEKSGDLRNLQVGKIVIRKAKPDADHAAAVEVTVFDVSGGLLFTVTLQDQDTYGLDSMVYIEYLA